jgi:hypothetical protein
MLKGDGCGSWAAAATGQQQSKALRRIRPVEGSRAVESMGCRGVRSIKGPLHSFLRVHARTGDGKKAKADGCWIIARRSVRISGKSGRESIRTRTS